VNVGEKHYEIPAEAKTGKKSKQKRWAEVRNIFPIFSCNFQGCHVPVDGSEILRSPVEVGVVYPIIFQGVLYIQTVVGNGISEPNNLASWSTSGVAALLVSLM